MDLEGVRKIVLVGLVFCGVRSATCRSLLEDYSARRKNIE